MFDTCGAPLLDAGWVRDQGIDKPVLLPHQSSNALHPPKAGPVVATVGEGFSHQPVPRRMREGERGKCLRPRRALTDPTDAGQNPSGAACATLRRGMGVVQRGVDGPRARPVAPPGPVGPVSQKSAPKRRPEPLLTEGTCGRRIGPTRGPRRPATRRVWTSAGRWPGCAPPGPGPWSDPPTPPAAGHA